MGAIKNLVFRWKRDVVGVIKYLTLSTTSTSASWTPPLVTNAGSTLTWDVTGDITSTSQNVDTPTFDLSANIGTVDMSIYNVSNLTGFNVVGRNVSTINVASATNLTYISCGLNQLTSLDVSTLINLNNLQCVDNSISNLDISNSPLLTTIHCRTNSLLTLDISNNPLLKSLQIHYNNLSSIVTNQILADLVLNGVTNGDLSYRNNETGQGVTDRATLVSRGWTIVNYAT